MIQTPKLSPVCSRFMNHLPNFSWANTKELWNNLMAKELSHSRNPLMMSRHPSLQPRMRSILLNWLSEVSEVYQLHRETYYLALDYFDRYLSVQNEVGKQQLQLVGITCLFIAAKVQEIYPPKVSDFAYVTDGACTDQQILTKELVILKSLDWNLNSMTVNSWLTIYMQLYAMLQKQNAAAAAQSNSASVDAQQRLSPSKHQPPRKRRRTALASSPGLQVADTNKQVVTTNCKREFDVKIDSDDEKQPEGAHNNPNNNLSNITNKQSDDHQSPPPPAKKPAGKEDCKTPVSMKSFISSNLKSNKEQDEDEFMYQKYDSFFYAQIAHLVDLSMLDIGSLKFSYNVISASALYHFTNMPTVMHCTGLRIDQIQECILWMTPFALAIRDEGFDLLRLQKNEMIQKTPHMQLHTVDLKLLDKAQQKCQQVLAERSSSEKSGSNHSSSDENDASAKPSSLSSPLKNSSTILTPPRSTSKHNKV